MRELVRPLFGGLRICRRPGVKAAFGRCDIEPASFQCISNLLRHQSSPSHMRAFAKVTGRRMELPNSDVPRAVFEPVLTERRNGGSISQLERRIGKFGSAKTARVQFALAEAMRFQTRAKLLSAKSSALYQDGSGPDILMRFSASDGRLNVTKGVLGIGNQVRNGGGATGIATTTKQISIASRLHQEFAEF